MLIENTLVIISKLQGSSITPHCYFSLAMRKIHFFRLYVLTGQSADAPNENVSHFVRSICNLVERAYSGSHGIVYNLSSTQITSNITWQLCCGFHLPNSYNQTMSMHNHLKVLQVFK